MEAGKRRERDGHREQKMLHVTFCKQKLFYARFFCKGVVAKMLNNLHSETLA